MEDQKQHSFAIWGRKLILAVEGYEDKDVATKLKRHLYINNEGICGLP